MTVKEKQHSGLLYDPMDEEIAKEQMVYLDSLREYNEIPHIYPEKRMEKLRQMLAEVGENTYMESPFYANWGGHHVHLGSNVYFNMGVKMVDDTHIYIGDGTMLGPNVVVATAGHPIDPELRAKGLQYNMPVHIGKNCWLGAGVIVMPGVTIGDDTVIGAGSIVTKDIPAGVVAVGNPCRVLREVGEHDREFYYKDRRIDPALFHAE